jgi:D-alanyl-D-alanine carboxypeptidase
LSDGTPRHFAVSLSRKDTLLNFSLQRSTCALVYGRFRKRTSAAAFAAFVFVLACLADTLPAAATSPDSQPQLTAAMKSRIRAAVKSDLASYGGKTPIPGVLIGIWTPDRGSMVEGIGRGQIDPAHALSLSDHVRIGSNTKTFVVTALLQLVDEKRLSLDDPISRFAIPVHVRGGDKITVRELMQMRSGLVEIYNLPALQNSDIRPNVPIDRVKWTQAACDAPRLFAPGTSWYYSNTNYLLLGMILETIAHDTVAHQLAKRIFEPMHLTQTTFPTVSPNMPAPYAHGYSLVKGDWVDESVIFPPSLTWAAGVMISDVGDMRRWVEAYVGGTQNGAATQRARLTCLPTGHAGLAFGLGVGCSDGWYGYTGGITGYNTAAYYLPSSHTTIIAFVMSQQDEPEPGVANSIFRDIAKIVTPGNIPYPAQPVTQTVPCARTSIASVRSPSGPAAYQHGTLLLENGASLWIEGSSSDPGVIQAMHMSPGDPVAACYGPSHTYADAGDSRAITVLDLKTSGSYGNVVGNWPGAK